MHIVCHLTFCVINIGTASSSESSSGTSAEETETEEEDEEDNNDKKDDDSHKSKPITLKDEEKDDEGRRSTDPPSIHRLEVSPASIHSATPKHRFVLVSKYSTVRTIYAPPFLLNCFINFKIKNVVISFLCIERHYQCCRTYWMFIF